MNRTNGIGLLGDFRIVTILRGLSEWMGLDMMKTHSRDATRDANPG